MLPNSAVHALAHPDFSARDAAVPQPGNDEGTRIQFRFGPHKLIAKTFEDHYPNYRNVLPGYLPESVTIPETHRSALIAWLRSLKGKSNSVRLTWETPGQMTLTHREYDTVSATLRVPVTTEGQPPEIAFDPKYLADALEIGATLRLPDKLNPGMTTAPSGTFCVLMSLCFTEDAAMDDATRCFFKSKPPQQSHSDDEGGFLSSYESWRTDSIHSADKVVFA